MSELVFEWPQITYCIITFLGLLIYALKNGEPKKGEYNFSLAFMMVLFYLFMLWSGGFFT